MANTSDYYDLLGLKKGATDAEIKSAYRKKAMEWHPDRHQGADKESAEKKFKEVNEAYQVLSDPQKKQTYDQYGSSAFSQGGRGGNPFAGGGNPFGQGGPFTYTYQSGGGQNPFAGNDFGDPFDIFEQFFGGGFARQPQKPQYGIAIEFMEAVHGVEKEVQMDGKKRTIKIPAGVDDGTRIRFNEFDLSIQVKRHKLFERDSCDIYVNQVIPFSLAALGGGIKVPTVDGPVDLKIRAGTQPGTLVRLKERGVPKLQGRGRGDQYVKITVSVPEKLNSQQKKLLEELQRNMM